MPDDVQNNAWVQVMLDTLKWEKNPIGPEPVFLTEMVGTGQTYRERGTVFTRVRPQQNDAIRRWLEGKERPLILEIGCGAGRHSDFIHAKWPAATVWGVESESRLLAVCQQKHGEQFVAQLDRVRATGFDLVLLLSKRLPLRRRGGYAGPVHIGKPPRQHPTAPDRG